VHVTTDLCADGTVRVITLSDPDKLNAIGDELRAGLDREVAESVADTSCHAIVITGANAAFSAGGELAGMPTEGGAIRRRIGTLHGIVRRLAQTPQVVLAAVDGVAYGSGMSLAAVADIVVASDRAKFGCTFGRVGLIPDVGFMWSVPRRIGRRRARLMVLQNMVIDAEEALSWGLADIGCPLGTALGRAVEIATQIGRAPAATLAHAKRMLSADSPSLDTVLEDEMETQIELLGTKEFATARQKFLTRRQR
jgi:2-(1,2-epoxy-1,2-dihydrophenyl)acetyl-CoA isomerase